MKIGSWLAGAFLALMCVSTAQAATITIVASADGEVFDGNKDGTFDGVDTNNGGIQVSNGLVNTPAMAVFEFDLSVLPINAVITEVQFLFRVGGAALLEDGFNFVQVAGAPGDGQITVADANTIAALLGTVTLERDDVGDEKSVVLSPLFADIAAVSPLVTLRLQSSPSSDAIAHFISSLEAGALVVPVDYRKPYGEQVGIAVIRARATKPAQRIGVVVGNPGGPGLSGVDFVLNGINVPAFARLRERFDVVSFDPRGVGRSRPVRCAADFPDPPADPDTADDATFAAYFDEVGKAFAKACLEQNGSWVTKLGTNNVARDIDMLRRALGEKQITYAAGSYGSELGATYASLFPERVRAVLLDGTVTPMHRDYFVEFLSEYSTAFEHAFRRLDQVCRRDAACRLADPGVVVAFDEIAARLKAAPVTSAQGFVLTADVFSDIVAVLLDRESTWPLIVTAIANARAGDFSLLLQLAPFAADGDASAFFAISCNDYGTRRPAADYLRFDEANGAMNPRFFGRFFIASSVAFCAAWPPADPPVIRSVRHRVDVPFLIIGNDFDSRTPLSSARRLADALGMDRGLVRYTGGGHTAFAKTTACIQETIETYLFDLRLPAEGFACPGRDITFAPSSSLRQTSAAPSTDGVIPDFWSIPPVPRGVRVR